MPLAVNKSINLGTRNDKRIDLAQKIGICVVIILFNYLHCDVIRHLPVQSWFAKFSLSIKPLFRNFEPFFIQILRAYNERLGKAV